MLKTALMRLTRLLVLAFVLTAMLYTTAFLLLCPFIRDCPNVLSLRHLGLSRIAVRQSSVQSLERAHPSHEEHARAILADPGSARGNKFLEWPSRHLDRVSRTGVGPFCGGSSDDAGKILMDEELFLSKVFANSLRPMRALPFFHRASVDPEQDDITVTTLATPNRYAILARLAEQYDGPLSVTVHITAPSPTAHAELTALLSLLASTPALAAHADIHLVLSPFPRAFNAWRNLARMGARTDYVLLLDADFALCTSAWRDRVRAMVRRGDEPDGGGSLSLEAGGGRDSDKAGEDERVVGRMVRDGTAALVLPAFEYTCEADGHDPALFPRTKPALLDLVRSGHIAPFHAAWAPGHNSTDYARFERAGPGEMYAVTAYQAAYEPYVIVKRDAGGWCDERFTGYGGNKAACLFEMYLSGTTFVVLADDFLVHQSHAYEEAARKSERKYNRKIYADFREEACLRHISRLRAEGALSPPTGTNNTHRASNALRECAKVRAVAKIISQIAGG